jgi:hypothetical protein
MRRPRAAVRPQSHRNLGDPEPEKHRFDDHLGRILHAGGPEVEAEERVAAEAAQAAVKIRDLGPEEEAAESGEDGVSEPAVERRHRALFDHAFEARAHDQVRAGVEGFHEAGDGAEVVREIEDRGQEL